jgi:ribosomal protein S18 acetylase RimI-like enzyme
VAKGDDQVLKLLLGFKLRPYSLSSMISEDEPVIADVPPAQRTKALTLVLSDEPIEERTRRVVQTLLESRHDASLLEHLIGAFLGQQLVGAAWGHIMPGRSVNVWGPALVDETHENVAHQLAQTLFSRLTAANCQIAQSISRDQDATRNARLRKWGFQPPIHLLYLVSTQHRELETTTDLEFEPFAETHQPRLANMIARTYVDSKDAPQLNGIRSMEDVIAGYRQTGTYDPTSWFLVRHENQDVGCLLLADHPGSGHLELIYMGIVPEARGRGWGARVIEFALCHAPRCDRRHLILAVDAENEPALRLYRQAGLVRLDRRHVALKVLQ